MRPDGLLSMKIKPKKTKKPPWERSAPRGKRRKALTATQKQKAKTMARKAGRRYPNLVDNMRATRA
jgi:hypothetical protein